MTQIDFESLYSSFFSTCFVIVYFYHYFLHLNFSFPETYSRYSFIRELPYTTRLFKDYHGSIKGVCFCHPQLARKHSHQADLVAFSQLLYRPSKPVAVVGVRSDRILKQGDCLAIYSESHAITRGTSFGIGFKKRLGVDVIGSTLLYFQTAIVI